MGNNKRQLYHQPSYLILMVASITLSSLSSTSDAEPFIPESDNFQVTTLSPSVIELHQQLHAGTGTEGRDNPHLKQDILSSYRIAARDNSARAYGRVLSLIDQWPDNKQQPASIRNIHASVLQHYHDFDQAIAVINKAIADDAINLTTQQIRFQVAMVMGEYALANEACLDIEALGQQADALNCHAQLQAATGQVDTATVNIQNFMNNNPTATPGQIVELLMTAGDIARRLDQHASALSYFTDALRINPGSHYLRLQYTDLLLAEARFEDAARFLATIPEQQVNDEIKIYYLRALSALDSPRYNEITDTLTAEVMSSFQASLEREEVPPHKDMAAFYYYVEKDPDSALHHARMNWQEQKEISDTLLLYRSAIAAESLSTIREVDNWLRDAGTTDARLEALRANQAGDWP